MNNNTFHKTIYAVVMGTMLFTSCEKISELETKWLTVESIGKSTIDSFFEEVSGLQAAGEGLHHSMENFFDNVYIKYGEITGENLCANTVTVGEGDYLLFNFNLKPEHVATYPRNLWGKGWEVVTNANNLIYYGEKLKKREGLNATDLQTINKMIGWGYFTRAIIHFSLCNCYAQPYCYTADASHIGIPVVTAIPKFDDQIGRESVATVYKQVLSDIGSAYEILSALPNTYDRFHVSSVACEALFARVYLYMQDWENAEKYSKLAMDHGFLADHDDYINMFRKPFSDDSGEVILRMNQYDGSSSLVSIFDPSRTSGLDFYPCPEMYTLYDSGDIRAELLTYIGEDCESDAIKGQIFKAVCKYLAFKSIAEPKEIAACPIIFRTSEMYLIHAEALANGAAHDLSGAAKDIAQLEARALGCKPEEVTLDYTDLASMNELIRVERNKELCYEGHSIFDRLRRGEAIVRPAGSNSSVKRLEFGDHRTILPIDQMEMQANDNMEQNAGY